MSDANDIAVCEAAVAAIRKLRTRFLSATKEAPIEIMDDETAKAELEVTIVKEWAKLVGTHNFTDAQKAEKLPILRKIIAGEKVTVAEISALYSHSAVSRNLSLSPSPFAVLNAGSKPLRIR